MSELLVAQCPFCQTRFRLSQEHLQAAAGNVRCGACLKVFNASQTLTPAPPAAERPASEQPEPSTKSPGAQRSDTLMIHDDMDLDDLDLESLGLDESLIEEINPAGKPDPVVPDPPTRQETFQLDLGPAEDHSPESTSFAEPEEEAEAPPEPDSDLGAEQIEEPDPWDSLDEADTDEVQDQAEGPEQEPEQTDEDLDLHDDFLATPAARDFATQPLTPNMPRNTGIFLRDRPAEVQTTQAPPFAAEPAAELTDDDQRQEPRLGELVDLPDLQEEPLVLYETPRRRRSRYQPLWIALSVLALLGLPAQAVYYNFSTLAHGERTRPYLEQFCFLAQCELPARVDITLMRSSNLMVRPHPEYPKALAIDVILYNRADFAQPFPVLRMTFNDTRGREVLSKRFRPDEYLGGELAGATLMPPQTPVRVALDMLDPGPEAAGYQLDFLSP